MKNNRGLTLIELLVTVAVVVIIAVLAPPMLANMLDSNRSIAHYNKLAGSLALARSESIRRGAIISICGSSDGASCNTANWETGWLVFADTNKDGTVDSGESKSQLYSIEPMVLCAIVMVTVLTGGPLRFVMPPPISPRPRP